MRGTDVTSHDEGQGRGLSPTTWAIMLGFLAVAIGYLLGQQTWIVPDWNRWWPRILGVEIAVYALTLAIPPTSRLTPAHGVARVGVGLLMRLAVALVCALVRMAGGDTTFLQTVKTYWAAHWPAALGEIACVAVAVYWFRYLSVQRIQRARAARQEAVPAALDPVGRSRDELLAELVRPEAASHATAVEVAEPLAPPADVGQPFAAPSQVAVAEPPGHAVAPTLEPVAIAPAEPAEPMPAATGRLEALSLPAQAVVRLLPPAILSQPAESASRELEGRELRVAWDEIAPQLSTGEVRVGALEVLAQLPPTVLAGPPARVADQLPEGVPLPLEEIVMRVPPEVFAPPSEQEPGAELPAGPPIFLEASAPPAAAVAPTAPVPPQATASPAAHLAPEPPPPEPVAEEPSLVVEGVLELEPREPESPEGVAIVADDEEELRRERALAAAVAALQRHASVEPVAREEAPEPTEASVREPKREPETEPGPEPRPQLQLALEPESESERRSISEPDLGPEPEPETQPEPEPEPGPEPVSEPEAEAEPEPASVVAGPVPAQGEAPALDPQVERAFLEALKGAGVLRVEVLAREGLAVVAADGQGRADCALKLAEGAVGLASASGARLGFALVTGPRGTAFVGGDEGAFGVYLTIVSQSASAGQVSVAARKALPLLPRVPAPAPGPVPACAPATEDGLLSALAREADRSAAGGFRTPDGTGVVAFALSGEVAAFVASAAAALWHAAAATQVGVVDRVLLVTARRTLGVAMSVEASALVVAGFEPGTNPGLAGAALSKLVAACDQVAAQGGY